MLLALGQVQTFSILTGPNHIALLDCTVVGKRLGKEPGSSSGWQLTYATDRAVSRSSTETLTTFTFTGTFLCKHNDALLASGLCHLS